MTAKKKTTLPKNPDCEPATKGYVKRVARKMYAHDHKVNIPVPNLSAFCVAGGWVATIMIAVAGLPFMYFLPVFLFSGCMTVQMLEHCQGDPLTYAKCESDAPVEFKAYIPPAPKTDECKPK